MKVYVCKFTGCYCGGLIVVAANSEDEAYNVFRNDDKYNWMFYGFYEDGSVIKNRADWTEEICCYHRKDFRLLKGVTADVETPQILAEDHYEE